MCDYKPTKSKLQRDAWRAGVRAAIQRILKTLDTLDKEQNDNAHKLYPGEKYELNIKPEIPIVIHNTILYRWNVKMLCYECHINRVDTIGRWARLGLETLNYADPELLHKLAEAKDLAIKEHNKNASS